MTVPQNTPVANSCVSAGGMTLLPAKPGTCPECAVAHDPAQPHNKQSLYYCVRFKMQNNNKEPTWADAMSHCTPEMKAAWAKELRRLGQKIGRVTKKSGR